MTTEPNNPHLLSLDRKNSNEGYVRGNVHLVCASVNWSKRELSVSEYLQLAGDVVKHHSKPLSEWFRGENK